MKNIATSLVCLATVVLATGCAKGPRFCDQTFPPLNPDQGRIFVYRTSTFGAGSQPAVKLNDERIGKAVPKGFFYVDRPAGRYEISTTTEVKRSVSFLLEKGQTLFVRLGTSMGFALHHVHPELVEPAKATRDIEHCRSSLAPKPPKP